MSVLGGGGAGPSGPGRRGPLLLAVLAATVLLGTAAWWLTRPSPEVTPGPRSRAVPPLETPAPALPAPDAEDAPREPRPGAATAPAPPASRPSTGGPLLRVESDVPGAFVFVDRKFVGETPLETRDVPAGRHQLNISAEGYDGISRTIDIAASGPTALTVELKTVRLDASVPVVHKHRFGSCEGRLIATLDGVRYQPSGGDHAFHVPLSALDVFEVDYLEKNLGVKRDRRTWNFTTREDNADSLLVFHREVQEARDKLAAGGEQ